MRATCEVCHRFIVNHMENMIHAKLCRQMTAGEYLAEIRNENIMNKLVEEMRSRGKM